MTESLSHIFTVDSELAVAVPSTVRARAIEDCVARTVQVDRGPWVPRQPPLEGGIEPCR